MLRAPIGYNQSDKQFSMDPDSTIATVYVIDDDEGVREAVALLLALNSYRAVTFRNAEEFLAACTRDWTGCALIDIRLKDVGGLELQRTLKTRGITLPVVMMTAHPGVAASRVAFQAGAIDFLVKPLAETELLMAIRRALSHIAQ